MKRKIKTVYLFLAIAAAVGMCYGCARYAPKPAPPTRLMLDITLKTAAPITSDFYYYMVLDTSNDPDSEGPIEELSGAERGKNWSYYIVYNNGFKERTISTTWDLDLIPVPFNHTSTRHYAATAAGDTIHAVIYLDKVVTSATQIKFNFITSRDPINSERDDIVPVDYLTPPYFSMDTARFPWTESSENHAQVSSFTPVAEQDQPADIISWSVSIYQR